MKTMKRFAAIAAATVMSVSTVVATASFSAFAADANTITVTEAKKNHSYTAYQIFKGTYASGKLTGVTWGTGFDSAKASAFINDLKSTFSDTTKYAKIAALVADSSAENVADALSDIKTNNDLKVNADADKLAAIIAKYLKTGTKDTSGVITVDSDGYYMVTDSLNTGASSENESISRHMLAVMGANTTVTLKQSTPTVTKKVQDIDNGTASGWQDSADYAIGDNINFQLTGTLPADYASYDNYYYEFSDTFSKGLTFAKDSVTVKVVNGDESWSINKNGYTVDISGQKFMIKIDDLKAVDKADNNYVITSDSKIVVDYTGQLNENAVMGSEGNPNEVKLIYSNNPNKNADGTLSESKGETPKDKVIVFTYELDVNKVKQDGKTPLTGAGFTLYKYEYDAAYSGGVKKEIKKIVGKDSSRFEFKGLDAGRYVLEESTTPEGYNTIQPIEFTITADHQIESDDPALTKLVTDNTAFTVKMTEGTTKYTGAIETTVINKEGTSLPTTGSIGTKIFYGTGATIALGAGVLLIAKKRAKKD